MRQARHLTVRVVAVNDVVLRRLHQFRLGMLHRRSRRGAIAALDCFLDGTHGGAQLGSARLVDDGAAGNLAGRLLGGSRIGHLFKNPSTSADCGGPAIARRSNLTIDAVMCSGVLKDGMPGRSILARRGAAKRTAAAGLRPPPLAGLIEGVLASVNAFEAGRGRKKAALGG